MESTHAKRERMSGAINALSLSPEGNSVVVAGRESKKSRNDIKVLFYAKPKLSFQSSFKDPKHQ